jgi:hypothetical protein
MLSLNPLVFSKRYSSLKFIDMNSQKDGLVIICNGKPCIPVNGNRHHVRRKPRCRVYETNKLHRAL